MINLLFYFVERDWRYEEGNIYNDRIMRSKRGISERTTVKF
jgi:hypothetical protein